LEQSYYRAGGDFFTNDKKRQQKENLYDG